MFSKWLQIQPHSATWDQLIQAIKTIKMNKVVDDIKKLILQGKC